MSSTVPTQAADYRHRILELDGIRGLAVAMILIWHYWISKWHPDGRGVLHYFQSLLSITGSGVQLFFVLSGFLIGGILMEKRSTPGYFSTFFTRRACRIVPLYLLVVAAFALASFLFPNSQFTPQLGAVDRVPLFSYLTFTQNLFMAGTGSWGPQWLAPTWSVAVEEQFYLLLPVVICLVPPSKLPHLLVAAILSAPLFRAVSGSFAAMVFTPCHLDSLMAGVLLAYAFRRERVVRFLEENVSLLHTILLVLLAAIPVTIFRPVFGAFGNSWLAMLYVTLIAIACVHGRGVIGSLLRSVWLRRLGLISYAVYLFHEPVNGVLHRAMLHQAPSVAGAGDAAVTAIAMAATLLLATLSYFFFEKPFIDWGHSLGYGARSMKLPTAAKAEADLCA